MVIVRRNNKCQNLNWSKSCKKYNINKDDLLRGSRMNQDIEITTSKGVVIRQPNDVPVWDARRFDIIQE